MPTPFRTLLVALPLAALLSAPGAAAAVQTSPPDPAEHFGFAMGTDRELARWDEILEYFTILADGSDRMVVDTLGMTTLGNPFVVVTVSSSANLAHLAEIREWSATLAQGRVDRAEAERIADDLPATAVIHHNIHSSEIGASQTSVALVHRLATGMDDETLEILDNVVTVLIPSGNPDGQIMITDWYRRNVGTEYEDARMPYLYHHFAGHDNNRDFFQANLVETRYWMDVMFHQNSPQLYLDQHQMGGTGPRMFVPPYPDPMDADIHPLQWQSLRAVGGSMVADLQRAGKEGVLTGEMYRIWGQEGALTGRHHNIVALLTETASADIATPIEVTREELERSARRLGPGASYGFQMAFPDPWWGGTWSLGDIVDYQMVAALSFLTHAARNHEEYAFGRWLMAAETIERARAEGPYAFVIPADQMDPVVAGDMAARLALQGVEVHRARAPFTALPAPLGLRPQDGDPARIAAWLEPGDDDAGDGAAAHEGRDHDGAEAHDEDPDIDPRAFPTGSWVVLAAQPGWAAVEDLLMPQGRELLFEYPDGPYKRSYDGAGYTMPLQMGVETVLIAAPFDADLERVSYETAALPASVPSAQRWWGLPKSGNASYLVANRIMADGMPVSQTDDWFLVPVASGAGALLRELVNETGARVVADPEFVAARPASRARVGLYQGWASSMDEGWTRYLLGQYGFDVTTLMNEDVREGPLAAFDVVILPSEIPLNRLVEGAGEDDAPEGFRGGIGEDGVDALKSFVRNGGTLVTLDRGDLVVLEHFDVPVRDALEGLDGQEVFTPASLYAMDVQDDHPLTQGMAGRAAAKWAGGRAYEPSSFNGSVGRITPVARWHDDPDALLLSGLVVGAAHIAGKAALLDVEYGRGRIYMYGFRVQHRAQTAGTFKLLFNALVGSAPRTASP